MTSASAQGYWSADRGGGGALLVDRVLRHATAAPDEIALIAGGTTVPWGRFGALVGDLAGRLRAAGVGPDELIGVPAHRDVDYVVGIVAAMAAGAAFVPLDPAGGTRRMADAAHRAGIRVGVGDPTELTFLDRVEPARSTVEPRCPAPAVSVPPRLGALAYALFTSGTTGEPHVVAIEQTSVVALIDGYASVAPARSRVVSSALCPFSFDVSIWELFTALSTGGTVVVISDSEARDPARLADRLLAERVTTTYLPPALLEAVADELCHRGVGSLERLLTGVEPVPQGTLGRFLELDPQLAVVNGYGPTETTVCAAMHRLHTVAEPNRRTPIGAPIRGWEIRLVDETLADVEPGGAGEILVGGVGLARGYLGDPELTRRRFVTDSRGRWYRTGDIGRRLADGSIEFVGRRDHQVKIRGFRVELGDIEATVLAHPEVRYAVAVAEKAARGRRLIVYLVPSPGRSLEVAAVRIWLAERLPHHLVPTRLFVLESIPLTTNGKVDRATLAAVARARPDITTYQPPPPGTAAVLAGLWARVLDLDRVGLHDNFFDLGGDSAAAIEVIGLIGREFDLAGQSSQLLACHTIAEQAAEVARQCDSASDDHGEDRAAAEALTRLTAGQEGLWARQHADPNDLSFVIPVAVRVSGPIDADQLAQAVDTVLAGHRALAMRVAATAHGIRQYDEPLPATAVRDSVLADAETRTGTLVRLHTDLARDIAGLTGSLTRAVVLSLGAAEHLVLVAAHHLVIDGTSAARLVADLAAVIEGREILGSPGTGAFASRQREHLMSRAAEQARSHWRSVFEVEEALELPLVRSRPPRRTGRGAVLERRLSSDAATALRALTTRLRVSPFIALTAATVAVAQRFSGQRDVVVAIPMATDRADPLVGDAVGYYANLVPIRVATGPDTSFPGLVAATATAFDGARPHSWYPFEELLGLAPGSRALATNRLTRLAVAQDIGLDLPRATRELVLTEEHVRTGTAKYELALFVRELADGRHQLGWEYDTDIFDEPTVARLAAALDRVLVEGTAGTGDCPVGLLDLLTADDRVMIEAANDTSTTYPADSGILALFNHELQRNPDAAAMVWTAGTISYAQLDATARALAGRLAESGVGAESPVLVLCERSPAFVIGVLAVLHAGGSYLPLDSRHPAARVADIAQRAGATHCVHTSGLRALVPNGLDRSEVTHSGEMVQHRPANQGGTVPHPESGPGHRACVMFTSGSTGIPKGVEIEDGGVIRLVRGQPLFPISSADRLVLASGLAFDAVTLEVWGALLNGACLVVPDDDLVRDPAELGRLIEREKVTLGCFNVWVFRQMLAAAPERLRGLHTILIGGEQVPAALVAEAARLLRPDVLLNAYGPAENTTISCAYRLPSAAALSRTFPVGSAIANSTARLVDEALADVGVGMVGELVVGGAGVARGYLGDPDLTRRHFVTLAGQRWYRTGDLGRWQPDGTIEFVGRHDRLVKIRGFRVELGDAEAAISAHPKIVASVAAAEPTPHGQRLIGYFVPVAGHRLDIASLRAWLADRLPDYLVPNRLIALDAIPLTTNGKVDHAALAAVGWARPDTTTYQPPPPGTATVLARLWARILDLDRVGLHDNFFDLGGDSRSVTELVAQIRRECDCELRVVDFIDAPTVQGLSQRLDANRGAGEGPGTATLREQAERRAALRNRRRR
jgi:amino acid adenylation domain-containing protein